MNLLYLSYNDTNGGAAIGAYRLHKALRNSGINSTMLVRRKYSEDPTVIQYKTHITPRMQQYNDWLATQMYPKWKQQHADVQSYNLRYTGIEEFINQSDADIVIMHWVGADTISLKEVAKIKKPIIWRLADMWAFSGSRHYSDKQYLNEKKSTTNDIDTFIWNKKYRFWKNLDITFTCGSEWLANKCRNSQLFDHCKTFAIPSSLDTDHFSPKDNPVQIRNKWGLDNRKIILFGGDNTLNDHRKGHDLLIESLRILKEHYNYNNYQLLIFGSKKKEKKLINGIDTLFTGYINDEKTLAEIYSIADVMTLPSRIDNLPFTAMEALSCGTPVVGFNIGGVPEIIDHKINGYVANAFNVHDFAKGIVWVLEAESQTLSKAARKKATMNYTLLQQATSYIKLMNNIISDNNK